MSLLGNPTASVLLPVYNGEEYLRLAIDSILSQDFNSFELIVINDGSTDSSRDILESYRDDRVRLIHQSNQGLAKTLNYGLQLARGKYIIRQDQDDVSLEDRISRQVNYLRANPKCALVGTRAEIWRGNKKSNRYHDHPTASAHLAFDLIFNNPFVHSSVAFLREEILALGGYSENPARQPPEDYELWSRISRHYEVANLPERLVVYRESTGSMSRVSKVNPFTKKLVIFSAENLAHACGMAEVDQICKDFSALTHSDLTALSRKPDLEGMVSYIRKAAKNISVAYRDETVLQRVENRIHHLRHQYFMHKGKSKYIYMGINHLKALIRQIR